MEDTKPQCGGAGLDADAYDLPLHVVALFLVGFQSFFGCSFPVIAKRVKWMKIPPPIFFFCKHFGTGVLVATAFVHLLPTAFGSLNDPCLPSFFNEIFPAIPGVIMMMSMFGLFLIEMWLHTSGNGHDHGGATGIPGAAHAHAHPVVRRNDSYSNGDSAWTDKNGVRQEVSEKPMEPFMDPPTIDMRGAEMPAWFMNFYNTYVAQINAIQSRLLTAQTIQRTDSNMEDVDISRGTEDLESGAVDPEVLRKMSLNITMLEGGILFHSIFIGMTLSVTTEGFVIFLIAILFHQTFEGLGLGSRIAAVPFPSDSWRPWILCAAFGTTTPIGQAIGLAVRDAYDPSSALALILVGTFNAMSSGLLIYAALVDLLAEDFLSENSMLVMTGSKRAWAFSFVMLGAIGMSIIGAFA